ncbi:MAG TPA: dienelactone hydrolase family protein [Caulobacteraceae bacterium]|jgi:carboxymethylenebutenolidase|nr:dienelactone hydrolase family protein [Caulobacteraceae bacterium]
MRPAPEQGQIIRLRGRADGFGFDAYHVRAGDARRGGLVILHAIWGVTPHLRALADGFSDEGYEVIVPSLSDRFEPGFPEQDIDETARARRLAWADATDWTVTVGDVQAAIDALTGPVFALGFCWGGTAAWMAAARCEGLTAAASFYGGAIAAHLDETPRCPVILHFGKHDELIPLSDIEAIKAAHPDVPVWLYPAGHAFMAPSDYDADSAHLARLRTLQLFHRSGGARGEMGG